MRKALLLGFLVVGVTGVAASVKAPAPPNSSSNGGGESTDLIQPLIDWVISKGGTVNDGLEIRRTDEGYNGMFANKDMPYGTLLLDIPRDVLVTGGYDPETEYGAIYCPTAIKLAKEWKLGDQSEFAPYTNYLLSQDPGELPSAWSLEGRSLLHGLLSQTDADYTDDLPPENPTGYINPQWYVDCQGSRDTASVNAALYLLQRGWDELMIPVYDMMSHRNGPRLNTETRGSVHDLSRSSIPVYASRDIKAGDEIYTTYNFCEDCGARDYGYGTPEILRDYGFVENYPQRWFFWNEDIGFELDEDEKSGLLQVDWLADEYPDNDAIWYLLIQLHRLDDFREVAGNKVPEHELSVIQRYKDALITAIVEALKFVCTIEDIGIDDTCELAQHYLECRSGGASCSLLRPYDDLGEREDPIDYHHLDAYTCDQYSDMVFDDMEELDSIQSHYQDIHFARNPTNDNVCFSINGIIQICGSYRPQYHEMVVHNTARFIKDVKRVLFVGGGDSMLLHEILKYRSIEFVVGLELDQFITRYAFKHMGAQPHWDNEKVQWWYGDAAKSLLMLPADYFGSFDMVLVDLSETVASFSVTDELDILQALTLLLKPEGIFVKNELYMDKLSSMFRYSLQVDFPDVPVVCSQCLVLGSNRVDFLNDKMRDHKRDCLFVKPPSEVDKYEYYHDYRHNKTADILCKAEGQSDPEPIEQTRSPGILMVVEVEDARSNLRDPQTILDVLEKSLNKQGFHPVSRVQSASSDKPAVTLILEEGYVVARTFPDEKYAAVDIHLWSSFDRQEAAKKAIVKALKGRGGKSTSSYRIVAGGMFGVKTWKEDEKKRGPHAIDPCTKAPQPPREMVMAKSVSEIFLEEILGGLVGDIDNNVVVVLCGENESSCASLGTLETMYTVAQVVPLRPCPGMDEVNEYEQGAIENMVSCGTDLSTVLLESLSEDKKIRAVIVDPGATFTLARVVYDILNAEKETILDDDMLALSVMFDESESWRRNFMERFRTEINYFDPNFRAEILFNNTESTVEVGLTTSIDDRFVRRLVDVVSSIEKKTGLESTVQMIQGGQFPWQWYVEEPGWKWPHYFLPHDYEQKPPLEQWLSQKPLAFQCLSQLESASLKLSPQLIENAMKSALSRTAAALRNSDDMQDFELDVSTGIGAGCVIVANWSGGNLVALWDGRNHIDLNWFTHESLREASKYFVRVFKSEFPQSALTTALVDEQPRGTGRVVNFLADVEPRVAIPHWAKSQA